MELPRVPNGILNGIPGIPEIPGIPRADDLQAGIRASIAGRRPEELEDEEEEDEENRVYQQRNGYYVPPKPEKNKDLGLELITEQDSQLDIPLSHMKIRLHPHQLAELHKMVTREVEGEIHFRSVDGFIPETVHMTSNIGILGDVPGYGKTATIIGLLGLKHKPKSIVQQSLHLGPNI